MKPSPFAYTAPDHLESALELLAEYAWDAKLLAGGQSLVPVLNFRLAKPALLIDLNRIGGLDTISESPDGGLSIGAMTRQRRLESDPSIARAAPLLAQAAPLIAHPQIRTRGTVGGSLAHADPAAELPAVAVALGASLTLRSRAGERRVDAKDFFQTLMTTALAPEEMLTDIALPPLPSRTGCAFLELARRHGDYATVGVAAVVGLAQDGRIATAQLVFLSVGDVPMCAERAGAELTGELPRPELLREAAELAAREEIDPAGDIHASAGYKRRLAAVLARRALEAAISRAQTT